MCNKKVVMPRSNISIKSGALGGWHWFPTIQDAPGDVGQAIGVGDEVGGCTRSRALDGSQSRWTIFRTCPGGVRSGKRVQEQRRRRQGAVGRRRGCSTKYEPPVFAMNLWNLNGITYTIHQLQIIYIPKNLVIPTTPIYLDMQLCHVTTSPCIGKRTTSTCYHSWKKFHHNMQPCIWKLSHNLYIINILHLYNNQMFMFQLR